jgi:hypothetical protein
VQPLFPSNSSVEVPLQPVKLFECIGKGGRDIGSRFAVQAVCLDEPGNGRRVPQRASKVPSRLGVVVGALLTGSVTAGNRQPSESDVVHDHIRLRQHQTALVARIGLSTGSRHVNTRARPRAARLPPRLSACPRP